MTFACLISKQISGKQTDSRKPLWFSGLSRHGSAQHSSIPLKKSVAEAIRTTSYANFYDFIKADFFLNTRQSKEALLVEWSLNFSTLLF